MTPSEHAKQIAAKIVSDLFEAPVQDGEEACKWLEEAIASALAQPSELTFADLIRANTARVKRWHPGGLSDWSPLEWAAAMAGEAGEACNAAKKLKRIDDAIQNINEPGRSLTDRATATKQIAKEVADTIIYGVLLVAAVGEDLPSTIAEVFNRKSEEYGFPERLKASALAHASTAHDDEKKKTLRVGDGVADSTRREDSRPQPEGSERVDWHACSGRARIGAGYVSCVLAFGHEGVCRG